jgi:hypothetical protein
MKDIKQDLQKKISSYQTLLKKTYGERKAEVTRIEKPIAKNEAACRPSKPETKVETLEQLKSAYFLKIQSLN